jgi:peptidoglycan/LPS O-acetylase OafA/YrhL
MSIPSPTIAIKAPAPGHAFSLRSLVTRSTAEICSPAAPSSFRIPALDGLRGIAILMVMMRHSIFGLETKSRLLGQFIKAGQLTWSGVDLFFVLSGFLIGGILLDARTSSRYFQTFYIRRAYRIFPLYGLITAVFLLRYLPFHFIHVFATQTPLTVPSFSYVTLTQNIWMVPIGWFGPPAMAATWSLAVEEQFYLTVPLLIRKLTSRALLYFLVAVVCIAPILRAVIAHSLHHGSFACYVLTPCRADALCLGVLAAYLVRCPTFCEQLFLNRISLYLAAFGLFLGVAYMTYKGYDEFSFPVCTIGYTWLALFYASCVLIAVSTNTEVVKRILCNRAVIRLGTLAYCSYLIHQPLVRAGRHFLARFHYPENLSYVLGAFLGIVVTLVLATLSWEYFEKPLLRRGHSATY